MADPAPGQVRVRVHHCGICHSDYTVLAGGLGQSPQILGHEASGVVDKVGDGVELLEVGDHVVLTPIASCGRCYWCTRAQPSQCINKGQTFSAAFLDGTTGLSRDGETVYRGMGVGGFAEYALVSETGAVKIADDIPLDVACVIGCAVQTGAGAAMNTAHVEPGSTVLVLGLGGIGLSVVQGARVAGAARIIALRPDRGSAEDGAQHLGATDVVDPGAGDVVATVQSSTDGIGVDYAFEAAGSRRCRASPSRRPAPAVPPSSWARPVRRGGLDHPERAPLGDAGEEAARLLHGQHQLACATSRRSWRCGAPANSTSSRSSPPAVPLDEINEGFADLAAGVGIRTVIDL